MGDSYYPFYPGDYARDTADLSMIEDGAYRRLLDYYYSNEELPADRLRLHRIAGANNRHERAAVDHVVSRFFCPSQARPAMLFARRVERELAKRRAFVLAQSEKGKKSGEVRRTGVQPGFNRGSTGVEPEGEPEGNRISTNHHHHHHQEKEKEKIAAAAAGSPLTDREDKGNGNPPPSTKPKVRRKKKHPPEALRLYGYYCEVIANIPAKKADALRNIQARLREVYTEQRLGEAIAHYATECAEKQTPEDRRYHSNNFFGMKGYFTGFLPEIVDEQEEARVDG
jgi:uncharacterized protein YdaU (DUF1376 family)